MKIVAISDQHGYLPTIPECDLLIIAGDICPAHNHQIQYQARWLGHDFTDWLISQPAKKVVAVWGNHDIVGEKSPHMVPRIPWTLLTDNLVSVEGLNIYGLPWQLRFFDWAFNLDEDALSRKYRNIPDQTNIIVSHGPPQGYGDLAPAYPSIGRHEMEHVGSPSLTSRILEIKPILTICGHIHPARGVYDVPDYPECKIINATVVDEHYQLVHKPVEIEIQDGKVIGIDA